jgi:hypothetical protein
MLGTAVAAVALFANVNTASADHCRSGGFGGGYYGGFSGHHHHRNYFRGGGYGYSNYRYSTPYYGSFRRGRIGRGYYGGYSPYYGGSGVYIQGRNFGFGLRY